MFKFFKNNRANRRAMKSKDKFKVDLKPGVARTPENLEAITKVKEQVHLLFDQHENNLAMLGIVQDVADGKMTEADAKVLIAKFTTNVSQA